MSLQISECFNNILSSLLLAFRKGYSCQSTLLNMIENFKCALDRGEYIACISMDIRKAFGCLPHCLTICKLHAFGLSRNACTLLASYLYKRKQRVKIGSLKSDWKELNTVDADDNSVSVNGKELSMVSRLLQSEAEITTRWFSDNAMEANPGKFQGILFKGNKHVTAFNVSVGGKHIEFYKSMSALGICIDENLTFDIQTDNICLKASRQISALQRLTGLLDLPSRKGIYNIFISSHFNYCPLVWFFKSKASIAKMQKIQERALRFVLKDPISDYETLLSKSDLDSFRISSIKIMAVEIYKILNDMGPRYLSHLFSKSIIPYHLRDDNRLIQPLQWTTSFWIKSFAYFGTHLWNMLPQHIENSVSLYNFKSFIRKWSGPTCCCSVCTQVVWSRYCLYTSVSWHMFFLDLLGYIWKTLLSLLAFYISTRLFCFTDLIFLSLFVGLFI